MATSPLETGGTLLREVMEADLPTFFEHQRDVEAARMAAFPSRDWPSFAAHWARIAKDASIVARTVVVDGQVAGNVVSFEQDGRRQVGYWIGRALWGRGIATAALAAFLSAETARPLYAYVARHNQASLRVLQKCGFVVVDADLRSPDGVKEVLLVLTG